MAVLIAVAVTIAIALGRLALLRLRTRSTSPCRVVFVHPDLGLGGAERLVVDMALALQRRGHAVTVYTSHHDPARSFDETHDGRLEVVVRGDWLPRTLCGRCHILCALLRGISLTCSLLWLERARARGARVAVVDQLSAPVPLLRLMGMRVIFYCHFPDKLLVQHAATGLRSAAKRAYRVPFDALEEACTGCAHRVLVNSAFTQRVYATAFPLLRRVRTPPSVLHPCVDIERQQPLAPAECAERVTFLSLNRYERKKNVALALRALAALPPGHRARARLAVAGGYDKRVRENVEHLAELRALAAELGIGELVAFHRSVSEAERQALLRGALAVVYTPTDEHFGIVPLEAMAAARAVVAAKSGGPLETIRDGETGFLCEPTALAMAAALRACIDAPARAVRMGEAGRARVCMHFSAEPFGDRLERVVDQVDVGIEWPDAGAQCR
ncbi:hypothetical protein KFE25_000505 [Diacronema lutheri]|uniref:Alpha-1,3/1,6-mannosyltransferase ALG2 n=1 Tax=Diacronema lutheri TaxID=2081491 RepID=A0A8J5XNV6_DIALT|nr:hypothetical protein KFE25_000505 [Diacronema lutheri]